MSTVEGFSCPEVFEGKSFRLKNSGEIRVKECVVMFCLGSLGRLAL